MAKDGQGGIILQSSSSMSTVGGASLGLMIGSGIAFGVGVFVATPVFLPALIAVATGSAGAGWGWLSYRKKHQTEQPNTDAGTKLKAPV